MLDDAEITRRLTLDLWSSLPPVLVGDTTAFFRHVDPGEVGQRRLIESLTGAPPLLDHTIEELTQFAEEYVRSQTGSVIVPFRDAAGRVALTIELGWTAESEHPSQCCCGHFELKGVTRHGPAIESRRRDARGRLPREQFVGSAYLRWKRLFDTTGPLDHDPSSDVQSAYLVEIADGDIHNGSLHQFYSNPTGDFAWRFPHFAARIGAVEKSEIIQAGNTLFDSVRIEDCAARNARLDELNNEELALLDDLTDRYYDADESIIDRVVAFIERHPDQFLC